MSKKFLKKSGVSHEYTPHQLSELKKCKADPIYFIENYVKIIHPLKGEILFKMHDYQKRIIRSIQNNRYNIVLSSRQSGKTVTIGAYILWFVIFHKKKTVLVVSNKSANAKEIIRNIELAYESVPDWLKPGVKDNEWNKLACTFENDSRVKAEPTSENSGRGMPISLLFCDEFAFVPAHIQEEFWASIYPVLSTGGSCVIASTPNGDTNLYSKMWRKAEAGTGNFVPSYIPWDIVPGRDESFKEEKIKDMGERKWRQEFACEFLSAETGLFDSSILYEISEYVRENSRILFSVNEIPFWKQINPEMTYIVTLDPATGSGQDFSVIDVYEYPILKQVAQYRTNIVSPAQIYKTYKMLIMFLEQHSKEIYFSFENNGIGQAIGALYEADNDPPKFAELVSSSDKDILGFFTSATGRGAKNKSCFDLKKIVEGRAIEINSLQTVTEMKDYERADGTFKAKRGGTDDTISAMLILVRIMDELSSFDMDAYGHLYGVEQDESWKVKKEKGTKSIFEDEEESDWEDEDSYELPFITG